MPETDVNFHLSPTEAAELIEAGAELIDVRRDYEWDGGRIAGARHLEVNELTAHAGELPKDRPVLFYCRGGNRSGMAAEAFRQAGYDAFHIAGGLSAWAEQGLPLDPPDGVVEPTRPS